MINLKHIEVFHAIMRTGSVTAAARALNVTQPAISAVLKHMENRLNINLFDRVGGRLQPTPEAHALMPDIVGIFGRLEAIKRLTHDLAGGRLGSLSIAATSPVANGKLARLVASFIAERPGTHIALQALASPLVFDRVAHREAEVGIAYAPTMPAPNSEVTIEVLGRNSIGCVMRSDHPLAGHSEIRVSALPNVPTAREEGMDVIMPSDRGFAVPKTVPSEIRLRLENAIEASLKDPEFLKTATSYASVISFQSGAEWQRSLDAARPAMQTLVNMMAPAKLSPSK